MEYILPRMECIVLSGINFDLTLNIPHKYVQKCCHAAYGSGSWPPPSLGVCCEEVNKRLPSLPSKDVDFVHLIRFFLDIVYVFSPFLLISQTLFLALHCVRAQSARRCRRAVRLGEAHRPLEGVLSSVLARLAGPLRLRGAKSFPAIRLTSRHSPAAPRAVLPSQGRAVQGGRCVPLCE